MSKLSRILMAGAMLAAISLASMTATAHAQAGEQSSRDGRRPATQGQVGEAWHGRSAGSQRDTAAAAALRRVQARERFSIPNGPPDRVPVPAPTQPNAHHGWFIASLGVLAVLMVTGRAVLFVRRASRRARLGQPA